MHHSYTRRENIGSYQIHVGPNFGAEDGTSASNILENAAAPTPVAFGHLRASRPTAGWRARRVRINSLDEKFQI